MRFPLAVLLCLPLLAQTQPGATPPKPEEGIPVTDPLVIQKCGTCHHRDDKGNLTRISWERTTPEGWEEAIKRMVRQNGVQLAPADARAILKSLSTTHGLAPEEAKPVMYIAENRMIDETYPSDVVRETCVACHALGRAQSWRRSKEEWDLLVAMHSGYYTVSEISFRRPPRGPQEPPPPPGTDTRQPAEQAADYFAKNYPLLTPQWAAWRPRMRAPKLSGRWLLTGYQAGRGNVMGEMQIEPGGAEDEFTTSVKLTYLRDGSSVTRSGKSVVYTGYSWRGRSAAKTPGGAPTPSNAGGVPGELREVMWISPDQSQMEGRWFWGSYQEFGYDITLRRAGDGVTVLGLDRAMLKTGSSAQRVRIFGDNFDRIAPADVDFGSGIAVKRILEQHPQQVTVEVDIDAKAIVGKRDVTVRRSVIPNALAVYDAIDYIKVSPETALARLGGGPHPKGFQQFDAIAYHRGTDGRPNTADDVELGPVDVEWSLEEFYSVYGDDDKDFVGTLSSSGFFTPAMEGPNPKRKFSRNNYGDVWVVANYKGGASREGKPLTAKSYLVVTIPLYAQWDQPEVSQ